MVSIYRFSLLVFLFASALVVEVRTEDVLSNFNWDLKNCTDYPFFSGGFVKCGVLEYCNTGPAGSGLYGYKQEGVGNCSSPGPTIRVKPGVKYLLTFKNTVIKSTESISNLHSHGLHISGDGNADSNIKAVETGNCIHYVWDIQSDMMGGTTWYHSHKHQAAYIQTYGGAGGLLIVEDNPSTLIPTTVTNTASITAFLKNEKNILAQSILGFWHGNGNPSGAALNINTNEWTRLRIGISNPMQTAPQNVQPLSIDTSICPDVLIIAYDGIYRTTFPGNFSLPRGTLGSARTDIAVRCNVTGGVAQIKYGDNVIGRLTVVTPASVPSTIPDPYDTGSTIWIPNRPLYARDLWLGGTFNTSTINNPNVTIALTNFAINGETLNLSKPLFTTNFNDTNEWLITGSYNHPLHLHIHHVQVVSDNCGAHEIGQYYDTISSGGNCSVRFTYADFSGLTLVHCHDLMHEDGGMITYIVVSGTQGIKTTLPAVDDYRCFTAAKIGSCRSKTEYACEDGEGRYIKRRSGSKCTSVCSKKYESLVGHRVYKLIPFSPKWACGKC